MMFAFETGNESMAAMKNPANGQLLSEIDVHVPLEPVIFHAPEFGQENGVMWAAPPNHHN